MAQQERPDCRCDEPGRYCPRHQTYNLPTPPTDPGVQVKEYRSNNLDQCGGGRRVVHRGYKE